MCSLPNKMQSGGKTLENLSKDSEAVANENQVSSDGSQPNPQDDMNSQKIGFESNYAGSPSDQSKPNEKFKDQQVN